MLRSLIACTDVESPRCSRKSVMAPWEGLSSNTVLTASPALLSFIAQLHVSPIAVSFPCSFLTKVMQSEGVTLPFPAAPHPLFPAQGPAPAGLTSSCPAAARLPTARVWRLAPGTWGEMASRSSSQFSWTGGYVFPGMSVLVKEASQWLSLHSHPWRDSERNEMLFSVALWACHITCWSGVPVGSSGFSSAIAEDKTISSGYLDGKLAGRACSPASECQLCQAEQPPPLVPAAQPLGAVWVLTRCVPQPENSGHIPQRTIPKGLDG